MAVGVPADWIDDVLEATEDQFLDLAEHLPGEASEALLAYVSTGILPAPAFGTVSDPFQHPDAQRRFRVVEGIEELEQALSFPWEKWIVFLHPSQRELVEKDFRGPARVMGSAGTGKSVVALHRAIRLAREPNARVLLTTFSDPLASALERKLCPNCASWQQSPHPLRMRSSSPVISVSAFSSSHSPGSPWA